MNESNLNKINSLVDAIDAQNKRIEKIERSTDLTRSAIDNGGIVLKDSEGKEVLRIGETEPGVVTTEYKNGPVPNQPSVPTVESGVGAITLTWDGKDAGGNPAPKDFKNLVIHASLEEDFEPGSENYVGVIPYEQGGSKVLALPYGTYFLSTAITTLSGQTGPYSVKVSADISSVVELPDVADEFAQGRADMAALDGKLAEASTTLSEAQKRLDEAEAALKPIPLELEQARADALAAKTKAEDALVAARTAVEDLPQVQHGTEAPTAEAPDGSVYFQHEGTITGEVIGQWVRSAGAWTSTPVSSAAIANLDVGKLTAGTAAIDVAVLNKVWADLGVFNRLTAGEAWIGGAQIKDGEITAPKITVTDELVANILNAQAVVADKLVANGNLWAKAAQIITLDASRLTVTDSATINEAVIEKFWAQTAVIQRLTAGEAWIGETVIKDGAITAPKIRADSVDASHIKARSIKADHMDFVSVDPVNGGSMSLDSSGIRLQREGSTIFQLTNASVDTISLIGADGTNVAGMSNDGSVTGLTGTFDQLNVGGMNLNTIMDEQPRGIVGRAIRTNSTGANPSTSTTHIQPVIRLEFPARAGYTYEIRAEGLGVYMNNYTGTTARFMLYTAGGVLAEIGTNLRVQGITPIRSSDNGDTAPISLVYHFTASTDYVASVMLAYSINKGTEPVRINCAPTRPFMLTAREFEKVVTTGKDDFLGTVSSSNTSTENVAAPRRETQTWAASAAASWAGSSPYTSSYAGSGRDLWQGYWSGSPNARRSHINFNGLGDKGKSIASTRLKMTSLEKLEVYLYNSFFYYYSGGKVRLHYHNSTTTSAYPTNAAYIGDVSMGRGEGKWIEITNANAKAAFLDGTFTGIALDPRGSTDPLYYGAFKGVDGGTYAPKIRATYLTT